MSLYESVWSYIMVSWMYMKAYGCTWGNKTIYESIWFYMNINGSKWMYMKVYEAMWRYIW